MGKLTVGALILLALMLPSCQLDNISSQYPFLGQEEEIVTILFSDNQEENINEHPYYDALIDFQQQNPEALSEIHIADASDQQLMNYYEVSDFPTMLVLNGDRVELRLEGTKDYAYILQEIELSVMSQIHPAFVKPVNKEKNS